MKIIAATRAKATNLRSHYEIEEHIFFFLTTMTVAFGLMMIHVCLSTEGMEPVGRVLTFFVVLLVGLACRIAITS